MTSLPLSTMENRPVRGRALVLSADTEQDPDWQERFREAVCLRPWFVFAFDMRSLHLRVQLGDPQGQSVYVALWPLPSYALPVHQPHVSVGTYWPAGDLTGFLEEILSLRWPARLRCELRPYGQGHYELQGEVSLYVEILRSRARSLSWQSREVNPVHMTWHPFYTF